MLKLWDSVVQHSHYFTPSLLRPSNYALYVSPVFDQKKVLKDIIFLVSVPDDQSNLHFDPNFLASGGHEYH